MSEKYREIKRLFGKFSKDYDKHMEETNHVRTQTLILDAFLSNIERKVLDMATGTGTIAKYIKEKRADCEVYGIDNCPEMIEIAKRTSSSITFEVGDAHNLPYEDKFFDAVTCCYGFYWFRDVDGAISGIKRVLKPKGLFLVMEEEFKTEDTKPIFSQREEEYLRRLAKLENYVGVEALKQKLKNAGFELVKEKRLPVDEIHDTVGILYRLT